MGARAEQGAPYCGATPVTPSGIAETRAAPVTPSGVEGHATTRSTALILGVGNPFRGDDGLGVVVARRLAARLAHDPTIEVRECPVGGLRLAEQLVGHHAALIIDALATGPEVPAGTVCALGPGDLLDSTHAANTHDTNLPLALRTLAALGEPLPTHLSLLGVAAHAMDTFTETLSAPVTAALAEVEARALAWCAQHGGPRP